MSNRNQGDGSAARPGRPHPDICRDPAREHDEFMRLVYRYAAKHFEQPPNDRADVRGGHLRPVTS